MKLLEKIFFIKKTTKHTIYSFWGLKLKIKHKFDRKQYELYINHIVSPNTILIVEINVCHWETIPGYCKYLTDLGFNVEIVTRFYAEGIFTSLNLNDKVKIFEFNKITFDKILKDFDFTKYERIIYNSKRVYFKKNDVNNEGMDLSEYYDAIPKGEKANIYIQHHINKIHDFYEPNQIILANPSKKQELEKLVVNPHYFGEFKLKNFKNQDIVHFISIGELSEKRRNLHLLISTVITLHNLGLNNFKITLIGSGKLDKINVELQKYFEVLGRVDYQTMFDILNQSDFMLPLLDPEVKAHKRYMDCGTSGTFQLIYGLNKPCIIHKTFADIYGFSEKNSIIYEYNDKLSEAMQNAINMTNEEYKNIQDYLLSDVQKIKNYSLSNFQKILRG